MRHQIKISRIHFYLSVVIGMLASGCADPELSRRTKRADAAITVRRWRISDFDTLWTIGGPQNDSILGRPTDLRVVNGMVVISDPGYRRVIALSISDGRTLWTSTGRGSSAPEFVSPVRITPLADGRIGVVEDRSRHMIEIDAKGHRRGAVPLGSAQSVSGACAIDGHGVLLSGTGPRGPLVALIRDTLDARGVSVPFPGDSARDQILLQARVAADAGRSSCVVAFAFGRGLALWNGSRFTAAAPYVENMEFPSMVTTVQRRVNGADTLEVTDYTLPHPLREAALDAGIVGNRVRVLFEGHSRVHGRIIDDYDARTLSYLGSVRLPFPGHAIAFPDSDVVIVLTTRRSYPMVVALRERSVRGL